MSTDPVTLARLASVSSGRVVGDAGTSIHDVTHDSRAAGPGDLFVAMRGARTDGHDYVATCRASAACVERLLDVPIPQLIVSDTRAAISTVAAEVHGHPSHRMPVVGITGTNGKTTVAQSLVSRHSLSVKSTVAGARLQP